MRWLPLLCLMACTPDLDTDDTGDTGDTEVDPIDADLSEALQESLTEARLAVDAPGVTAAIYFPDVGTWHGAAGWADDEANRAMPVDARMRIASITKTFVASTYLQLQTAGKVDLDDSIGTWLPGAPHPDDITLRMLLSHTSGLDDYVERLDFLGQTDRAWDPWELIALVADEPLLFSPGDGYRYSNAGYILLGLALQEITGEPWTQQVRSRFLDPLALDDITTPSTQPGTDTDVVGYFGDNPATGLYNPLGAWSAGEMVSDADDLTEWARLLYGGAVLTDSELTAMTTSIEAGGRTWGYGLGCQIGWMNLRPTVGHSGATTGFQSRMRYDVQTGLVTVVMVNSFTVDEIEIEEALWDVLDEQFFE